MMDHEPFLPEHVPPPSAEPQKKQSRKAIVVWLVIILGFMVLFQLVSPSDTQRQAARSRAESAEDRELRGADPRCPESDGSSWTFVAIAPSVLLIGLFVVFVRRFGAVGDFNRTQEPGLVATSEGRFAEAAELFRKTAPKFAKKPIYRAVLQINIGFTELRSGRLDASIQAVAEVERILGPVGTLVGSSIRILAGTQLALGYALKGDLGAADRWITESRSRLTKGTDERISYAARLTLAEAIVRIRRGAYADAMSLLVSRWRPLSYSLSGDAMRGIEVVCALAEAQGRLCEPDAVAQRLSRVRPVNPDEFRYLGAGWPEMQAFLVEHKLGTG